MMEETDIYKQRLKCVITDRLPSPSHPAVTVSPALSTPQLLPPPYIQVS